MNDYVQLGELIDSISKTHKFDKEELVFLNTSDVSEGKILINHYSKVKDLKGQAKKTIKNGDILYSEIRPKNRRYAYVKELENPEDYVVSTKLMVLRNKSELLDNDYLYQFLTAESTVNYLQRKAENRIGSFPQITFNVLKQIKIWLPEIKTQKQIAKVLSDLDAKIELNNQINQQLESMAKTLYDYWFVQFDFPVSTALDMTTENVSSSATSSVSSSASLRAESRSENDLEFENKEPVSTALDMTAVKGYKSAGGKMVYNEELKREIPDGWESGVLSDIANITMGQSPAGSSYNEEGLGTVFYQGSTDFGSRFPTVRKYTTEPSRMASENDILLSVRAPVGTLNQATESCCIGRGLAALNEKSGSNSFLWSQMEYFKQVFDRSNATGTTFGSITKSELFGLQLSIPPQVIVNKFKKLADPLHEQIVVNAKQNQKLTELRDWLLPMLMNGQATVGSPDVNQDQVNSNLNSNSNDAGLVDGGLGRVAGELS
ncbi:restriction endonuclease subunit S [Nonlabens sp.]|uniref:restriction endonuclease subunit S n=1 Tax=Nonlabens sp. TaxID=1888209 RepID=UPI001BD0C0A0|nr:restriction endonuclease subunit S [Nonlabens sp.]